MIIDSEGVFKLVGLSVGKVTPVAVHCPLCGGRNKLEVRSIQTIRCMGCGFFGDALDLFVSARNETFDAAVGELTAKGYLVTTDTELAQAKARQEPRAAWREFLRARVSAVRRDPPPFMLGILDTYQVKYHPDLIARLYPHILPAVATDFLWLNLPKEAKDAVKFWGKRGAIVIPTFNNVDVIGLQVITVNGSTFLPVVEDIRPSAGFANAVSFQHETVALVEDPIFALRKNITALTSSADPVKLVCPVGAVDTTEFYRPNRITYWAPENPLTWTVRALQTSGARVCLAKSDFDFSKLTRHFIHDSQPPHATLARLLLEVPEDEAKAALSGITLEPVDKAKCLAQLSGDDAKYVESLLSKHVDTQTVSWNGAVVTETAEGWLCRGKLIASATLRLNDVEPVDDDAVVTGVVMFKRKAYPFRAKLSAMRKNTGAWLTNFIVKELGQIPYIDNAWSSKLLEIAQQFKPPTAILGHERYGWKDGTLRVSDIVVSADGLQRTAKLPHGPQAPMPLHIDEVDQGAFKSDGFCKLWLILLGNAYRSCHGKAPFGISLANEPYVPQRIGEAFGLPTAAVEQVAEYAMLPLPMLHDWNDRTARSLFVGSTKPNTILSADRHTQLLLSIRPDWITLRVGDSVDYVQLTSIFTALPTILSGTMTVGSNMFYRDMAEQLGRTFPERLVKRLERIAGDLDTYHVFSDSNQGSKIMLMLLKGVQQGSIVPSAATAAEVVIAIAQIRQFMASPFVPAPAIDDIVAPLKENSFLTGLTKTELAIRREVWDLSASYAAC